MKKWINTAKSLVFTGALFSCSLIVPSHEAQAAEKIIIKTLGNTNALRLEILNLAMQKSGRDYEIVLGPKRIPPKRRRKILEQNSGEININWDDPNDELEKIMRPVKLPAYRGLSSTRLLVINKDKQSEYGNITQIDQLFDKNAIVGPGWAAGDILRNSGLKVIEAKFSNIRNMIAEQRGDYYPAGVLTVMNGLTQKWAQNPKITVENTLLLKWPVMQYIYVTKEDTALHDALYDGISKAIADGSYDKIFKDRLRKSGMVDIIPIENLKNRKLLEIKNPLLTEEMLKIYKDGKIDLFKMWEEVQNEK